ncbi:MAG: hypothetical protein GT589_08565 [Peptoclostridium sp.]|uniref:pilus assembly protein TadG-related protein n=1 Tax=Peptoclostridium sp. TaxID=1904860 RepID=UPI00139DF595|nr:pilus assembly protein TadG-related protein [Peptoclostridium sp.]MZQ76184.1 hypothetical protein [Peptoclostridium sp.]
MHKILRIVKNRNGQALVIFALSIMALMGFAAIAVDVGMVAKAKSDVQNAADAAALAGAQYLPNEEDAIEKADSYAGKNGASIKEVDPSFNDDPTKIEVVCTKNVQYAFAKFLGYTNTDVDARAVAQKIDSSTGISGLRPWALKNQYEVEGGTKKEPTSEWVDYIYTYGQEFVLKVGGGGGSQGYYGVVAFGDQNANSADVYKDNITNGYDGIVKIGDFIMDGPGNMNVKNVINALMTESGDTEGDYTKAKIGNSRVVLIPKIDAQTKEVIGFAAIYLKSVDNQGYITANFLYDTTWSDEQKDSLEDWGLETVKLIE